MSLIGHILIGCPGSGKSTVAQEIQRHYPSYKIISSDALRVFLYGDASIQGDWGEIERVIFQKIDHYLRQGYPIIYDATNAKREWRIDFLEKLNQFEIIKWVGWNLQTPLDVCQGWNTQRKRQVPPEIIEKMYNELKEDPPTISEGFMAVYQIPYYQDKLDLSGIKNY